MPYTPDVSSPKNRPRRWFGPDDFMEGDDPATEIAQRDDMIRQWDEAWAALPWYVRFWRSLTA